MKPRRIIYSKHNNIKKRHFIDKHIDDKFTFNTPQTIYQCNKHNNNSSNNNNNNNKK